VGRDKGLSREDQVTTRGEAGTREEGVARDDVSRHVIRISVGYAARDYPKNLHLGETSM
jgi:hypothetical protein